MEISEPFALAASLIPLRSYFLILRSLVSLRCKSWAIKSFIPRADEAIAPRRTRRILSRKLDSYLTLLAM